MRISLYLFIILFFFAGETFSNEKNKDLLELKKLLDAGIINIEEFNSAKKIITEKDFRKKKVLETKKESSQTQKVEPTVKPKKKAKVAKTKQIKKISFCKLKNNYRIIKKENCIGSFKKISQEDYVIGYLALSGDNLKKSQNRLNKLKKQFKSNNIDLAFINKTIAKNSNLKIYANLTNLQKSIVKKNNNNNKIVKDKSTEQKIKKISKIESPKKIIKKKLKIEKSKNLEKKITEWEKSVITARKDESDFQCKLDVDRKFIDVDKKKLKEKKLKLKLMDPKKLFKKKEYCIKKSEVLMLGKFQKLNYPKNFLNKQKGCKTDSCLRAKAGKKVYQIFVKRGPQYHARYPGAMIEGMVWFELLYLQKLRTNEKRIKRYLTNNYDGPLGELFKSDDPSKLYSLIKMNKGRIKMREALGFSLYDSTDKIIEQQFLLSEFLNRDKLKVVKNEISPNLQRRKDLIDRYKSVLSRYREKLEEEKNKKEKKNENENKKS